MLIDVLLITLLIHLILLLWKVSLGIVEVDLRVRLLTLMLRCRIF